MIPGGVPSTVPVPAPWAFGPPQPRLTESRHIGGVALNDTSQGMRARMWTCTTDGTNVRLSNGVDPPIVLFTGAGITEVSLAFDQNMNPFVAFVDASGPRFRWFDPVPSQYVITPLPAGSINPRATLDDNRETQTTASDVILAYVRGGVLFYRQQRDRFTIEYTFATGVDRLNAVGMNSGLRLQFQVNR